MNQKNYVRFVLTVLTGMTIFSQFEDVFAQDEVHFTLRCVAHREDQKQQSWTTDYTISLTSKPRFYDWSDKVWKDIAGFSDKEIVMKRINIMDEGKKIGSEWFTIDRQTGSLSKAAIFSNGHIVYAYSGSCEKIAFKKPPAQKNKF